MNFNKKIWLLILLSSLLRILVACTLELGNDEVYYQTYALHLQWNYFDHPPMVALLIRLSTFNQFFQQEFFIRLGSIICSAAGTWIIFIIGRRINNARTGWLSAILYNTSFYTSIIAGTFILPDSPQVLCWLLSMYLMIRILEKDLSNKYRAILFIFLGISVGACIMSKIHGVFLWLGFGGYLIFHRKDLLKSSFIWISFVISLLIVYPVYQWNLNNHFITYSYHQGRINFWGPKPDLDHLLQQVLGSVFYNNPVNFILYILTLVAIATGKFKKPPKGYPLYLWLSLPLILILLWTSLFSETLPHWSGPSYLSLMILGACWLDEKSDIRISIKWLKSAASFYVVVVLLGIYYILFLPIHVGSRIRNTLGKGDISLDMSGWNQFALQFDSVYQADVESGRMKSNSTIISDYWFPAGHLDHYYGIPYHHNLLVFGPVTDIHHFAWLNERRPRLANGSDAYFIYPTNYYGPPGATVKNDFEKIEDSLMIPQFRNGILVRYFVVYRLHDFRGNSRDYLIPGIH